MSEYQAGDGHAADPSMTEQAQEKVQQTAQKASQKGAEYVRRQTETRAAQVSTELRSVVGALQKSGHALHADGNEQAGRAVDAVTKRLEQVAGYLQQSNGERMLHDLESFGRRRPWGLIGLGLGVGVAASRFLKASSRTRYEGTAGAGRFGSAPQSRLSGVQESERMTAALPVVTVGEPGVAAGSRGG